MKNFKNYFLILFLSIFCLCITPSYARAGTVDNVINYSAKTAYYITKYTLVTCKFIVVNTVKASVAITKGVAKGTKDAFNSNKKSKTYKIKTKTNTYNQVPQSQPAQFNTLPTIEEFNK